MEPNAAKESIVSRLFGFGRKPAEEPATPAEPAAPATASDKTPEPRGFARTEDAPKGDAVAGQSRCLARTISFRFALQSGFRRRRPRRPENAMVSFGDLRRLGQLPQSLA